MNDVVGGTFIGLLFLVWVGVLILPTIFFILTQQKALSKCAPRNQTMSPGLVWLQIIPFFGFIWQFFVVFALANSLGSEFRSRGIEEEDRPGQGVGLAMCITRVCVIIPILGIFSLIASVILWIVYWVKIAGFSRQLDYAPAAGYSVAPYGAAALGGSPYSGYGIQPPAPAAEAALAASSSGGAIPAPGAVASQAGAITPAAAACPTCGAWVAAGAAFCTSCGTRVDQTPAPGGPAIKKCPHCEAMLPADATFCAWCGSTLDDPSS